MYLNEREASLLSGMMEIEFSKKDTIALARSFEGIIKFKCGDENLIDEATKNTLLTIIPKQAMISKIKSIRPDLSPKINKIID